MNQKNQSIISSLRKIWQWISVQGISEAQAVENAMTQLLNQFSFISSMAGVLVLLISFLLDAPSTYYYIVLLALSNYAMLWIFNYWGKIFWSRFWISVIVQLWFNLAILLIGGFFAQSMAAATTIIISAACYKNRPKTKRLVIGFNIISHCSVLIYASIFPPFLTPIDILFDEIIIFIIALGWVYALFDIHRKEKEQLIAHLKNKNQELKTTTEELERFTYIASHDLKSPLRNIMSFAELIEKKIGQKEYDQLNEYLGFVKTGATQMNVLIQDILELSKIDHLQTKELKQVALHQILKKATDNLQHEIAQKKALIHFDQLPHYPCNESEFVILFQNLIQNGIKYNKNTIPILQIWAIQDPYFIHIHFKDNGIGIAPEYFQKIFQYFKRLHNHLEYKGTGIGLGLCKKIVAKYDGDIFVESVEGQGSTFIIQLPLANGKAKPKKVASFDQHLIQ